MTARVELLIYQRVTGMHLTMVVDRVAIVLPGGAPFGMGRPQGTSGLVLMMLKYHKILPSGYVKIAIENDHRNSGFSHEKWWFSIAMLDYQRVDIITIMVQ